MNARDRFKALVMCMVAGAVAFVAGVAVGDALRVPATAPGCVEVITTLTHSLERANAHLDANTTTMDDGAKLLAECRRRCP